MNCKSKEERQKRKEKKKKKKKERTKPKSPAGLLPARDSQSLSTEQIDRLPGAYSPTNGKIGKKKEKSLEALPLSVCIFKVDPFKSSSGVTLPAKGSFFSC
jgi:hypothetical protein